jgi:glycosyltransferase involved in cell wall biosynthesis
VRPLDVHALAAALTRIMRDGAQRAAMGRAARRHFERTMSPAVAYDRLMAIYEQVWRARIT